MNSYYDFRVLIISDDSVQAKECKKVTHLLENTTITIKVMM